MLEYERQFWARGLHRLAGIDEAGRGPLAGPVVAAAVIIEPAFAEAEVEGLFRGLTDSKKLSAARRETFDRILRECPHVEIGVGMASVEEIDDINILRATHLAMQRSLEALQAVPSHVLVDGLPVQGLSCASTAIVKGDALSLSIAAASVVAKVARDAMMVDLDRLYPQYGFARHKGYGSALHMQALLEHGPLPEHRRSFRPVRDALETRTRSACASQELEFDFE